MMSSKYEYFLKIVEHRSISKAAQELLLSQPYLSQYLTRLEKGLGVSLFNRSCIPLELTAAGKVYLNYVQESIALDNQLAAQFDELKHKEESQLTIGISGWRASFMLPRILNDFCQLHPRVKISVREGHSLNLKSSFSNGLIDVCLLNSLSPLPSDRKICVEQILLAVPTGDPMAAAVDSNLGNRLPAVSISDFADHSFILVRSGSLINTAVRNLFDKSDRPLRVALTTESVTTAINMASEGLGLAFVPELGAEYELLNKRHKLRLFLIKDPPLQWHFVAQIKINKMHENSALIDDFLNITASYCKQHLFYC